MLKTPLMLNPKILEGKIFNQVKVVDNELILSNSDESFKFYHNQDCCEDVSLEDYDNDLDVLCNTPILNVDIATNCENPKSSKHSWDDDEIRYDESSTWTFYKFATAKGHITFRWYGSSNGYYSEEVDFALIESNNKEFKEGNIITFEYLNDFFINAYTGVYGLLGLHDIYEVDEFDIVNQELHFKRLNYHNNVVNCIKIDKNINQIIKLFETREEFENKKYLFN